MYCSSCGSLINEGQSFCANCGAPVPAKAAQPVAQVQQPVVQPQQPAVQPQSVVQSQAVTPQPVSASPAPVKKSNGMAITAFVLGIFTLCFAWIIFVNAISVFTGLAGAILAIIGLNKKNCSVKAMAVIGLIASLIGMIYSILMWATFWSNDVYNFMEPLMKLLY